MSSKHMSFEKILPKDSYIPIFFLHLDLKKNQIKQGGKLSSSECQNKSGQLTSSEFVDYHLSKL